MEATETGLEGIALRFCKECLGWKEAKPGQHANAAGVVVDRNECGLDAGEKAALFYRDLSNIEGSVTPFLGTRFWMQINRDLTTEFQWLVTSGQQNLAVKGSSFDHARARNDDLGHAMLEACVKANEMKRAA